MREPLDGDVTVHGALTGTGVALAADTMVDEPSFAALCEHTARWLRTIRSVPATDCACCLITFSLPIATLDATLGRISAHGPDPAENNGRSPARATFPNPCARMAPIGVDSAA